ncbi:MAG: 16S rRNA (guanine(966)-N(2))-methyltransferase RsmD [Gammaproteobacteria bacterium]
MATRRGRSTGAGGARVRPGAVRIIGGRWRGRRLPIAPVQGLRPTPDRVRETLFNWLAPVLPGARCLDLFAGTGALGLEACSRGAREVVLVEQDPLARTMLAANVERLGATDVTIVAADAVRWLATAPSPFDVVFLDPPYRSDLLPACCARLQADGWLAPAAWIYVESPASATGVVPPQWSAYRSLNAGQVHAALYRIMPATAVETATPMGE